MRCERWVWLFEMDATNVDQGEEGIFNEELRCGGRSMVLPMVWGMALKRSSDVQTIGWLNLPIDI